MSATETLVEFIRAMHEWETQCSAMQYASDRGEILFKQAVSIGKQLYRPIHERFLCLQGVETRETDFHFSIPPEYDPNNEIVLSAIPNGLDGVNIRTCQQEGLKNEYVYKLRSMSDVWKICEKWLVTHDNRLIQANL